MVSKVTHVQGTLTIEIPADEIRDQVPSDDDQFVIVNIDGTSSEESIVPDSNPSAIFLRCHPPECPLSWTHLSDARTWVWVRDDGKLEVHGPMCFSFHGASMEVWLHHNQVTALEESSSVHSTDGYIGTQNHETCERAILNNQISIGKTGEAFRTFFDLLPHVTELKSIEAIEKLAEALKFPYRDAELTVAVGLAQLGIWLVNKECKSEEEKANVQEIAKKAFCVADTIFRSDSSDEFSKRLTRRLSAHRMHLYRETGEIEKEIAVLQELVGAFHPNDDRLKPVIARLIELDPENNALDRFLTIDVIYSKEIYRCMAQAYELYERFYNNEIIVRLFLIHNKDEENLEHHLARLSELFRNNPDHRLISKFCTSDPIKWPKDVYGAVASSYEGADGHPNEIQVRQSLVNQWLSEDEPEMLEQFYRLYALDDTCAWVEPLTCNPEHLDVMHIINKLYDEKSYVFAHQLTIAMLKICNGRHLIALLVKCAYATHDREHIIEAHRIQIEHNPSQALPVEDHLVGFDSSEAEAQSKGDERRQHMEAFLTFCKPPEHSGSGTSSDESIAEDTVSIAEVIPPLEESACELLADLSPDNTDLEASIEILMRAAMYLEEQNKGESALGQYDKIIKLSPRYLPAYEKKYRLLFKLNLKDEINIFSQTAKENFEPDEDLVELLMKGASYLGAHCQGVFAMEHYDYVLTVSKSHLPAFCAKYNLFVDLGQKDEGVKFISTTLKKLETHCTLDELVGLLQFISEKEIPIAIHDITALLARHLADTKVTKKEQEAFRKELEEAQSSSLSGSLAFMPAKAYQLILSSLGYGEQ